MLNYKFGYRIFNIVSNRFLKLYKMYNNMSIALEFFVLGITY